eukprot:TRINITY_DN12878_c0_g1_i2.p1 TRINITY_DN12878_c0_g1~~TRINITY_DN12878_c0_g1_i2.p1  ORF type:complete len:611 (+),score=109.53 TRINITY_DN12878_c0_g1_i2:31-1833(+)
MEMPSRASRHIWTRALCAFACFASGLAAECQTSTATTHTKNIITVDCEASIVTITCDLSSPGPVCTRHVVIKTTTISTTSNTKTSITATSSTATSITATSSASTTSVSNTETNTTTTRSTTRTHTWTTTTVTMSTSSATSSTATSSTATSSTATSYSTATTSITSISTSTSTTREGSAVTPIDSSSVDPSSIAASTSRQDTTSDRNPSFEILAGSLRFVSNGTNKTQAEAAVRSELASRLGVSGSGVVAEATKESWLHTMLFSNKTLSVWRVNFAAPVPSDRFAAVKAQMLVLSKAIAEDTALGFSSSFRKSLTEAGAQPAPGLLAVDLQLQDTQETTATTSAPAAVAAGPGKNTGSDGPVLVVLLIIVGLISSACVGYWICSGRKGAGQEPSVKIESGAYSEMEQLEYRRWTLGESSLEQASQALSRMPKHWNGTWTWVAQTQLQGAASAPRQKRYSLSFEGGTVEGHSDDNQVTQRVIGGAYDPSNGGKIMWREVPANSGMDAGLITECEGQLQVREPQVGSSSRMCVIQGTFAAFDTSTAPPQRRGRGHFVIQAEAHEEFLDQAPAIEMHEPPARWTADEDRHAAPQGMTKASLGSH